MSVKPIKDQRPHKSLDSRKNLFFQIKNEIEIGEVDDDQPKEVKQDRQVKHEGSGDQVLLSKELESQS